LEYPNWKVTGLFTYPIKSCKGTSLQQARIGTHGMPDDRRFMIVEKSTGMFVAQRGDGDSGIGIKSMCQITPTLIEGDDGSPIFRQRLEVTAPGMNKLTIFPLNIWHDDGNVREVQVWGSKLEAAIGDLEHNQWFTEFLSRERPGDYEFVMMRAGSQRRAKHGYSQLRFADGYPFLVISQESLDDLNQRIGGDEPLPMNRFRPNIVISGGNPYDEDRINRMLIGNVDFEGMKLCVRCPTTQTDQETAKRGKEPIKTLLTYRPSPYGDGGVVLGRNFNHLSNDTISVGDTVQALAYQAQ